MQDQERPSLFRRIKTFVLGGAISPQEPSVFHKLSLVALLAWVGLGADGLSSSAYGPQETFLALGQHPYLAVFAALISVVTIFVISASYSQIIELFPSGGGGYLVASKLLSPSLGAISGCALLVDYVLTIAISIAAGSDAIFSFLPQEWQGYKLALSLVGVLVLTVLNLRGVKESVVPLVPVFVVFLLTHIFAILYALVTHLAFAPHVVRNAAADIGSAYTGIGLFGILFVVMRAYSLGAGTYTGIEAVSNGLSILREPRVRTARRTMVYMAVSLSVIVAGLLVGYLLYNVQLEPGKTLNAVLFENLTAGWSPATAGAFVLLALASEAALLFVAAQTGFIDGPRVLANMALDRWLPTGFATLSNRLVTQNGVLLMGGAALAMVLFTGGSVAFLVVLYSINVFITFVLSQLGMVRHLLRERSRVRAWKRKLLVNGTGLVLTTFILVSMAAIKFNEGGWITLLITGAVVGLTFVIKGYYENSHTRLRRLDHLVAEAESMPRSTAALGLQAHAPAGQSFDSNAKTAVLFVSGYGGLGLYALRSVNRMFGGVFRNFVFVQVGEVGAGTFKGSAEIKNLQEHVKAETDRYVTLMRRHGYYAESVTAISTDVVDEAARLAPKIRARFPQAVFFGGQHVYPEEAMLSRLLHNNFVFAVQRSLYRKGIPFVILPVEL